MNVPPPPPPAARVAITGRLGIVTTLNSDPAICNQFLSDIDGRLLVPEYTATCTQPGRPPARPLAAAIPAWISTQVDAAANDARLTQRQHSNFTSVSHECVRSEFEAVAIGSLLFLEHLGIQLPTARHRVRVPGFTENRELLTRGRLWMAFSTGSVVRGAAFPGLNHFQLQARSIVALEALAMHTDAPVFTIAIVSNAWTVFYLPDRGANAAVRADRHAGVGHQALMQVLIDLLVAIA